MVSIYQINEFTTYRNSLKNNFYLNDPNSRNELLKIFYPNIQKTKREEISEKGWPNEKTNTYEIKTLIQILKKNIDVYINLEKIINVDEDVFKKYKIHITPYQKIISYVINNFYIYKSKPNNKEIETFIQKYFDFPKEEIYQITNETKKVISKYETIIKKNNIDI